LDFAWKPRKSLGKRVKELRFNPCCIGFCLEATPFRVTTPSKVRGFNPCCIGFCLEATFFLWTERVLTVVSTLVVLDFAWKHVSTSVSEKSATAFQPLLYWILLGSEATAKRNALVNAQFQPLLYWILLGSVKTLILFRTLTALFQPLLYWILLGSLGT